MSFIKSNTKNIIQKGKLYTFHREQNAYASNVLKIIEKEKGPLNVEHKKMCVDYSIDVLGHKKYAPWLFVYTAHRGEFIEGWIPDNFYGEFVVPQLKGAYGHVCNRNAIISKIIEDSDSLDICYFINHLFVDTNGQVLIEEQLRNLLFSNNEKVVFKIEDSFQGKGIYIFDKNTFDLKTIKNLGNGVFQEFINQHAFFLKFNKTSVATIRITTTTDDSGNVEAKAGFLKFGKGKETHLKSTSSLKIPIHIENGLLFEDVYFPNWSSAKELKALKFSWAGEKIPQFDSCISKVCKLHSRIPYVRCIGWDIIVDNNSQVKVIELNGIHNGIRFHEMTSGPCFKNLNWEGLRDHY